MNRRTHSAHGNLSFDKASKKIAIKGINAHFCDLEASLRGGETQTFNREAYDVSLMEAGCGVLMNGIEIGDFEDQTTTRDQPVLEAAQNRQRVWLVLKNMKKADGVEAATGDIEFKHPPSAKVCPIFAASELGVDRVGFNTSRSVASGVERTDKLA